jgi:dipeptidyl aminopeptidase/acylaminoacyl peptidase
MPEGGWPAVVFNHGYIPPPEYRTTEKYLAYTDAFSRNGFVVLRPDYRGHGNSDGEPTGAYGSPGYTIDVLNAFESLLQQKSVNQERVGMWGHSMGGYITLRAMVVNPQIKAGVIWGGVVGSYPDLLSNWHRRRSPSPSTPTGRRRWREELLSRYGEPESNPEFWQSISANSYLSQLAGPVQLHHGEEDSSVPVEFSRSLASQMEAAGKEAELFTYPGDDHNISRNLSIALARSVEFFRRVL